MFKLFRKKIAKRNVMAEINKSHKVKRLIMFLTGIILLSVAFNIFIALLGLVRVVLDFDNVWTYIIGLVSVSGFLLILYILTCGRGIGGGDIKLMAAAGLLLGWKGIVAGFFIGISVSSNKVGIS